MPYTIRADRDGYRRGGMAHSTTAKVYPEDAFTPEQLSQLQADPRILIQEVPDSARVPQAGEPENDPPLPKAAAKAASKPRS